MSYFLAFIAYLCFVGMKAMQQRQVMNAEYLKMPPLSYGMAFCEVFVMATVAKTSDSLFGLVLLALAIGTGGALGSILGTYLHVRKHPRRS